MLKYGAINKIKEPSNMKEVCFYPAKDRKNTKFLSKKRRIFRHAWITLHN